MNQEERTNLTKIYFELKDKIKPMKEVEVEMKGIKTLLEIDYKENNIAKQFVEGSGVCTFVTRNNETLDKKKVKLILSEFDYEKCVNRKTSEFLKLTAIEDITAEMLENLRS